MAGISRNHWPTSAEYATVVMEVDGLPRLTGQLDSTAVILEAGT